MQTELSSPNLRWRVKASGCMAGLNFALLPLPEIPQPYYRILLIAALTVNVAVCWLVLRNVEPLRDRSNDRQLVAFTKRCILWLGFPALSLVVILALLGRLSGQVVPFLICGYAFLLVPVQVLRTSLNKRVDEFLEDER